MGISWLGERDERNENAILPAQGIFCCLWMLERREISDFNYQFDVLEGR
jgi:hypothetical protein